MGRIGMYSYYGYPGSLEERVRALREAGFEVTGIGLGKEEDMVREGRAELMPGMVRAAGLEIDYVHAPEEGCNGLWSDGKDERERVVREYGMAIDFCVRHGIGKVVVHVSRSKGEQPGRPGRAGLGAVREIVEHGGRRRVRVAIENTQRADSVDYLLGEIDSEWLGLCYDTSHDFLYSKEPGALLRRWGARVLVTHLGDNDGMEDRHWLPGEGVIDWVVVKKGLGTGRYEGVLNLEVFPKGGATGPVKEFLERAMKAAQWVDGFLSGEQDL